MASMAIFSRFLFFILILICSISRSYEFDERIRHFSDLIKDEVKDDCSDSEKDSQGYCKSKANDDISNDVDSSPEEPEGPPLTFVNDDVEYVLKFRNLLNSVGTLLRGVHTIINDEDVPDNVFGAYLRDSDYNFVVAMRPFFKKLHSFLGAMMFNYYIKLIPTVIERMDGYFFSTNQFSVTKFEKHLSITEGDSGMPGIFFSYELSPLMVKRVEQRKSLSHLIMTVLSYISGVYIAALLVDSFVHKTVKYVQKLEIGKQS